MCSPIPPDLPPQGELIARLRDLDDQIRAVEGIFETLGLLADSFGLDRPDTRSIAYRAQVNAGRRYVLDARMKSMGVQTLFTQPAHGGRHA